MFSATPADSNGRVSAKTVKRIHDAPAMQTPPRQAKASRQAREDTPDLRQGEHHMIPSDSCRDGECGCDRDSQGSDPTDRDGDLTDSKRQCARGQSDKRRADDSGAAMKCQHPDTKCDEKRQRIDRQRKDQPAEQPNTKCVENKPKGEQGGGSNA
jgi:hypothetical protein